VFFWRVPVRALDAHAPFGRTVVLRFIRLLAALATAAAVATPHWAAAQEKSIIVFAAASMKNALDDIDAAFTKKSGIKVLASYAASSALMKQIEQGAPADVYVSADLQWMDYGSQKKLVQDQSRVNLLGNRLVLVAPKDSKIGDVAIGPSLDLAKLADGGRIATGDVRAVPVGLYAKAALEKLGLWASVEPKMAMADNVRAALILVARGEATLGIVYETDAKVEPGVKIIGVFPDDSHPPIVYPVALTINAKPEAAQYLAFLRTQAAKSIFEGYGFSFLIKPTS
jgi:molybdate transport system substrate-binding protein